MRAFFSSPTAFFFTLFCFATFLLFKAWVCEDAYITARVLDNAVNGYGLTWNINERVQVYTHPLWLLAQLPLYAITHEFFYTTITFSLLLVGMFLFTLNKALPRAHFIGFILIPLFCSRSVTDYMTSGLESPLTFLLLTFFTLEVLKDSKNWRILGLLSCLLILTRFDNLLLILPTLSYLLFTQRKSVNWQQFSIAFLPLWAWSIFSLIYYGFVMPNTKYAKLNMGLDLPTQLSQGVGYFYNFLHFDLGSCVIFMGGWLAIFLFFNIKRSIFVSLISGALLYALYVIFIGGDYMSGRFFAAPVFLILISFALGKKDQPLPRPMLITLTSLLLASTVFSQGHVMKDDNVLTRPFDAAHFIDPVTKIHDERGWSWNSNHLIKGQWLNRLQSVEDHTFVQKGLEFKKIAGECGRPFCYITQYYAIGMAGYYAGAHVHIIDIFGIGDALLARLPMIKSDKKPAWAGHYYRHPPEDYKEAIEYNNVAFFQKDLGLYYSVLREIISGQIWSIDRLSYIIDMQFGTYDYLLENYNQSQAR